VLAKVGAPFILSLGVAGYLSVMRPRQRWVQNPSVSKGAPGKSVCSCQNRPFGSRPQATWNRALTESPRAR
jgi:hypothetical protein